MTDPLEQYSYGQSDIESGIAALHELVPELTSDAIRDIVRSTAAIEQVDPGTCAQMLRTEVEAGRLPVDQFKALAKIHASPTT